jgi:hypothetical protein
VIPGKRNKITGAIASIYKIKQLWDSNPERIKPVTTGCSRQIMDN